MINKNRIVRGLAGLLAVGVVGAMGGGAVPQPAAADAQPGDQLPSSVLLRASDLSDAGWKDTVTGDIGSDDGALLGLCAGPTPDLAPGFTELRATGLNTNDIKVNTDGLELVMAFKTNAQARDYVQSYRTAIEGRCLDLYGPKKWDVKRSSKVTLVSDDMRARTWTVKDKTIHAQTISATMVRVDNRVALVWLGGYPKNPTKTLHLHTLIQAAANRITY